MLGIKSRIRRYIKNKEDNDYIGQYLRKETLKKLHIGAGAHKIPGWLNADVNSEYGDIDSIYLDAKSIFRFDDETFDYIYSEHMIEHIGYNDGMYMLSECYRVLKPEGMLRIATPNLEFLISLYDKNKTELQKLYIKWSMSKFIYGAPAEYDTFVINNFVRDWGHLFIYDEKTLRLSLRSVGFLEVTRWPINKSNSPELTCLENTVRMPDGFLELETMVFEAKK